MKEVEISFLEEQDRLSMPFRAERLRYLVKQFGHEKHLLMGGMSAHYFEEARLSYLNGIYVGCVMLTQAAIEELLRHFFRLKGDDSTADEAGFSDLISKSSKEGFITHQEAIDMDNLRKRRNPYMHPKGPAHPSSLHKRMVIANFTKDDSDLMREDAEEGLEVLFGLLQRYPFSFPVGNEHDEQ